MAQRILVVDDEPAMINLLTYNLRKAHYDVVIATDGRQAIQQARESTPDLIVLDLMLPEIDGWDVCRTIRQSSQVPIIILTAQGEEIDRVVGLELGADDYVCKPFSVRELMARIKAVLRRTAQQPNAAVAQPDLAGPGGLKVLIEQREVLVQGARLDLSRLEFDLLHLLLVYPSRVFTREQLLDQVWGYNYAGDTRAVDNVVKRLRAKLRAVEPQADCIVAVRGVGYKLQQDAES